MGFRERLSAKMGGHPDLVSAADEKEIARHYKIGSMDKEDCQSCSVCYPDSLSIDETTPLFKSAQPMAAQIIIASGQSNWKHNVNDEDTSWGRVCKQLDNAPLSSAAGGPVRINVSDIDAEDEGEVEVIVLPQFAKVSTTPNRCIADVIAILSTPPGGTLPAGASPVPERGFIMLCSHRQRDKRCGVTAPLMKQALDMELRDHDLYRDPDDDEPGGVRVIFCNHVGGHKFAANALIYQNQGMALMLARLRPEHSKFVVEKTIAEGVVAPEYVRTCNQLQAYQW